MRTRSVAGLGLAAVLLLSTAASVSARQRDLEPVAIPPLPSGVQRLVFAGGSHLELGRVSTSGAPTAPFFGDAPDGATDYDPSMRGDALVFASKRVITGEVERDGEIWYRPDASVAPRPLTDDDAVDRNPELSRNGEWIAFESNRAGNFDIWIIRVDGSGLAQLTYEPGTDAWPTWSPSGDRVAFASDRDDTNGEIYTMSVTGGDVHRLTNDPAIDSQPAWAPGGDRIAYTTNRYTPAGDVVVMSERGGPAVRIIQDGTDSSEAAWSPDGKRIAFASNALDPAGDVLSITLDEPDPVTHLEATGPGYHGHPTWQGLFSDDPTVVFAQATATARPGPDGQPIGGDLISVNADGTRAVNVTERPGALERAPTFSADGRRIAYTQQAMDGGWEIALADADGRNPRVVVFTEAGERVDHPTLSPDGSLIAYTFVPFSTAEEFGGPQPPEIRVSRVQDGAVITTVPTPSGPYSGDMEPAWSPDGNRLAFVRQEFRTRSAGPPIYTWRVWIADISSPGPGQLYRMESANQRKVSAVGCAADATTTTSSTTDPVLFNVAESAGPPCRDGDVDLSPAWSPDGRLLAYTRNQTQLIAAQADGTGARLLVEAGAASGIGMVAHPAWSPEGAAIAFAAAGTAPSAGQPPTGSQIFLLPAGGGVPQAIVDTPGINAEPVFQPSADLRVSLVADPSTVAPQTQVVLTMTVHNAGPKANPGVISQLMLPKGMTAAGIDTNRGKCELATLTCRLGTLAAGSDTRVEVKAVSATLGTLTITGAAGGALVDLRPDDNLATTTLRVGAAPDVRVTITNPPSEGYVGGDPSLVTYTVENVGELPAEDVSLVITAPGNMPIDGLAEPVPGCRADGRRCDLGTIEAGPAGRKVITVRLKKPKGPVNGETTGTVRTGVPDADRSNDRTKAPVRVRQPTVTLNPENGPPGMVTVATGRDFPPGALVRFTWTAGITSGANEVIVEPDGTFQHPMLIFPKDPPMVRQLRAEQVGGAQFSAVSRDFIVTTAPLDAPDSSDRRR